VGARYRALKNPPPFGKGKTWGEVRGKGRGGAKKGLIACEKTRRLVLNQGICWEFRGHSKTAINSRKTRTAVLNRAR